MNQQPKSGFAWEPLTPRGIVAFSRATFARLFLVQLIFALLAAASVVWFLDDGCFPTVRQAIQNLPDTGKISAGKLDWKNDSPKLLAEGKFLAFDVDLRHSGKIHSITDFQFEFGENSLRIFSWLGYTEIFYPPDRFAPLNRTELEPLWGAWRSTLLFFAALTSVVYLLVNWLVLATIYFLPVWLLGFFANRDLNFRGSWKLAGAALMPGALLMTVAIFLYDFGTLDLVQLGFWFSMHFVLGWIYLLLGVLFTPRIPDLPKLKNNPFAGK